MKPNRRFATQLFPTYLLVTLLPLVAVTWHTTHSLETLFPRQAGRDLLAQARIAGGQILWPLSVGNQGAIDAVCKETGRATGTRFTVIFPDGQVAGDSLAAPGTLPSQRECPEFLSALRSGQGLAVRRDGTDSAETLHAAVSVENQGHVAAVVRASESLALVREPLGALRRDILLMGLAVAAFAALVSLWTARRASRPLEELRRGAEAFARGDLERRIAVPQTLEIGEVALALNAMAEELALRLGDAVRQKNELKAVLSGMVEGVLAVNTAQEIISMNEAGARMLHCGAGDAAGRPVHEVARNVDLQRFVERALASEEVAEGEIGFHEMDGDRFFQVHGAPLKDEDGLTVGAVVVLNDVTRLHRLEEVRRDFVANVSHELKTPITAISGFVETLAEGAVNDPVEAARFLSIIQRHARRLGAITEDLLTLSRLEHGRNQEGLALDNQGLCPVLKKALLVCQDSAKERGVEIRMECDPQITARVHPSLFEQAVVNLLTNAVTYSEPGTQVDIEVEDLPDQVAVRVRDQGRGIAQRHLARIFERFYRVDPARSREHGGTGLGLSIVKHIAQAHGGRVNVTSVLGKGSVFSLHLPKAGRMEK
jgi:two-component system phosphate regulon sensor histidine kinase PhoR